MGESYYEILEVDPEATRDEIETAYRERVLETHPDHSDDPDAAEQFKRVTDARSVLTDGTERARYDRLGHESYVGLAQGVGSDDDSSVVDDGTEQSASETDRADTETKTAGAETADTGTETTDTGAETSSSGSETSSSGAETASSETSRGGADAYKRWASEWARTETETETTDESDGAQSHHARQRSRRQRRRAKQRSTDGWPFEGDGPSSTENADSRTSSRGGNTTKSAATDGVQYSVHDWDDEVDLEWDGPTINQSTAVTVGLLALLYPLFVAASLTSLFSLPVNAIVAACTLVLVGYLLTFPRIATVTFGVWSVLFPVALVQSSLVDPVSVVGLLVIAFAWVPFGYAIALWWVLRP